MAGNLTLDGVIHSHMDEILDASSHLGETGNNKEQ